MERLFGGLGSKQASMPSLAIFEDYSETLIANFRPLNVIPLSFFKTTFA